jgi:hypothetical protein
MSRAGEGRRFSSGGSLIHPKVGIAGAIYAVDRAPWENRRAR